MTLGESLTHYSVEVDQEISFVNHYTSSIIGEDLTSMVNLRTKDALGTGHVSLGLVERLSSSRRLTY